MRVSEVLSAHLDGVRDVLDISRASVDLLRHYQLPEELTYARVGAAELRDRSPGPEQLLIALVGYEPSVHVVPDELAALADCRPGHRSVLLLGWPIAELPTNLLLTALAAARCQIVATVPLSTARIRGVHAALVVRRVDHPVPTHGYLQDVPAAPPAEQPRALLRMVNEYQLTDFAHRPLRQRLRELAEQVEEQRRLLAERDDLLRRLEQRLTGPEDEPGEPDQP